MPANKKPQFEFIALMAAMMSLAALSIDAILPGLPQIGETIHLVDSEDLRLIIIMIFLGLGVGQLVLGTLSDSFGRKPIVYAGIIIFLFASYICISAQSLEVMLLGRVLQGIGLSAPRSVSTSIIRDLFSGDYMARIMSFITVVFILVPMVAPILGQSVLNHFSWQAVFYFQMFFGLILFIWFAVRQEETLPKSKRITLTRHLFADGVKEFFRHKDSIVFTLISGMMTGAFMVYLSSSQHIFQEQYGLVDEFVFIFAGMAFFMGLATFMNGTLVVKIGMKKLANTALYSFAGSSLLYILLYFNSPNPNVYILLFFIGLQFLSLGFIFGNVRALTMQPLGHIAGIGASLSGFISTIVGVPIAVFISQFLHDTALPLFFGFFGCGMMSLILIRLLKSWRKAV